MFEINIFLIRWSGKVEKWEMLKSRKSMWPFIMEGNNMKNKLRVFIQLSMLSLMFTFGLPAMAWPATYYVSNDSGNDSNPGISEADAFKTIQKANDLMIAGDNCIVFPGNYPERITVKNSGTPQAPIVFQANSNVVMKGFRIHGKDFIHIRGFEITDTQIDEWTREGRADGAGIAVEGRYCEIVGNYIHNVAGIGIDMRGIWEKDAETTSNCIVKENTITYAGICGIQVEGRNHLVEANDISHTLQYPPKMYDPPSGADADGIRFFGTGHIIRKNYIHDILDKPENPNDPHIDFFQTWGNAYGIVFEQNLCVSPNTSGGNQILMLEQLSGHGTVRDIIFRNNIFVMNDPGYSPMVIMDKNDGSFVENFTIVNNVFAHPNDIGDYAIWLQNAKNVVIKNNIFLNYGNYRYSYLHTSRVVDNVDIGYNCVYNINGQAPNGDPNLNDLWMVDPNFKDIPNLDFSLRESSPLIDMGIALTEVREDYLGTFRPQGIGYDIGAFEFIPLN